jgi:hypothetical protein
MGITLSTERSSQLSVVPPAGDNVTRPSLECPVQATKKLLIPALAMVNEKPHTAPDAEGRRGSARDSETSDEDDDEAEEDSTKKTPFGLAVPKFMPGGPGSRSVSRRPSYI